MSSMSPVNTAGAVSRFGAVDNVAPRANARRYVPGLSPTEALVASVAKMERSKQQKRWRHVVSGVGVLLATGCAASFQTMYEGDVMFEHCYRLDIDVVVPTDEKRACWDRWLATGTRGQTRDRVEFAAARSRALLVGPSSSGVAFLHIAAPLPIESAASTAVACPLPETPFEAPPSTVAARPTATAAPSASAAKAPDTPETKRQFCIDACAGQLATCAGLCTSIRCGQKCTDEVKSCMAGCL